MRNRRFHIFSGLMLAVAAPYLLANPDPQTVRRVQERFVAPCCWQENLAIHQSPAAEEMRAEVARLAESGKTEQEIVDYYVARYGERILREPLGSRWIWLTFTPIAAAALAALLLGRYIKRAVSPVTAMSGAAAAAEGKLPGDDLDW
jgi:cytochrome c-type biogenesis protein CcmH/NrfF